MMLKMMIKRAVALKLIKNLSKSSGVLYTEMVLLNNNRLKRLNKEVLRKATSIPLKVSNIKLIAMQQVKLQSTTTREWTKLMDLVGKDLS